MQASAIVECTPQEEKSGHISQVPSRSEWRIQIPATPSAVAEKRYASATHAKRNDGQNNRYPGAFDSAVIPVQQKQPSDAEIERAFQPQVPYADRDDLHFWCFHENLHQRMREQIDKQRNDWWKKQRSVQKHLSCRRRIRSWDFRPQNSVRWKWSRHFRNPAPADRQRYQFSPRPQNAAMTAGPKLLTSPCTHQECRNSWPTAGMQVIEERFRIFLKWNGWNAILFDGEPHAASGAAI